MTTDTHTPNPWNELSYGPITGSGAKKLASSRVAPLVAIARGYWAVTDKEAAVSFANLYRGAAGANSVKTGLTRLVSAQDEDLLAMPWFAARAVAEDGAGSRAMVYQYRPSTPVFDENGKAAKYKFFPGQSMVIDIHPSTPVEWLDESKEVLVTEGLLKGDSALTAQLLQYDTTVEELSKVYGADGAPLSTMDARLALQALMLRVPASLRTVIASSASVTTWQGKDADWRKLRLRDKRVVVAFDGDLSDNVMVWRETSKFFNFIKAEKGVPSLLTLFSPEVALAQIGTPVEGEKLGIDDYFEHIGTWQSLMDLKDPQLPGKPVSDEPDAMHGDWRVHPKNDAIVEEFVEQTNPATGNTTGRWVTRARVGGRLISHVESRRPTEMEIMDGAVNEDEKMRLENASCEIEISLLDRNKDVDDEPETFRVYGPSTLMSIPPQDWTRHAVQLPNQVLAHPDWPPRKGLDWLGAVKANKRDQIEEATAWNTMGWVPVPGGTPAFIVGRQVLAANEEEKAQTRRGVDEHLLPGSDKFGVMDEWDPNDLDGYKAQIRKDIKAVLDAFIENGFWTNRTIAVAVLCASLRGTIPKRPGTTIYFVGPKGKGKSFSASFVMRPWQSKPGTWTRNNLPGNAGDTFAAHENSISMTPIWVIDDLAPQPDRRKAEAQENALSDVIRANHNNAPKRRLDGRTMAQRDVANPIAMLAVTAENPPVIPSILDRILVLNLEPGSFNDTDDGWREKAIEKLCNEDGAPARLAAAMIRFWQQDDTGLGNSWSARIDTLNRIHEDEKSVAFEMLEREFGVRPGEASRSVDQVTSLGLTLTVMYQLALWAGVDPEDPMLDRLGSPDGYSHDLYSLAAVNVGRARSTAPGAALMKALGGLMRTGRAHLRNATTPGAPPFSVRAGAEDVGGTDVGALNEALGWEFDPRQSTWVPRGHAIGYFGSKGGEQIALFETSAAFKEAQRAYPELIPHGQGSTQSWNSVYSEGFAQGAAPARKDTIATRTTLGPVDAGPDSKVSTRLSGVPVLAEKLLEISTGTDED